MPRFSQIVEKLYKNIVATIITLMICAIALTIYSLLLVTKTSVLDGEETVSASIMDSTFIYRNKFNIPHIIANNEHDAFFSLGYAHAQDRLWQMDIARRTGKGKLSEIFGEEALNADKFMRALGIADLSKSIYARTSKTTKFILTAYSDGINHFLHEQHDKLPFEFGALSYSPEDWTPTDCIILIRLMGIELTMSIWSDLAFGEIADKYGIKTAVSLIPVNTIGTVFQYQQYDDSPNPPSPIANFNSSNNVYNISTLSNPIHNAKEYLGFSGDGIGSNAWIMRTNVTNQRHSVILANDPHLKLSLPARWYQAHITCPGFNAIGATIPGLPLIVSGRNDISTWGITNMMNDDFDYFIEKIDPKNSNYYYSSSGKKVKFTYKRDTIIIKNSEPHIYDIRYSQRSPIISDAPPTKITTLDTIEGNTKKKSISDRYCLSFEWTGRAMSDEILGMYRIMKSTSWKDFQRGTQMWGTPALNFVYGDKNGTIASTTAGLIPERGSKANPNIPSPGWLEEYSWKGLHKPSELPNQVYSPNDNSKRYIVSANNPLQKSPVFFHSNLWEPSSRAERLNSVLKDFDDYDVRDAQFLQLDVQSPYAQKVMENVLPILISKKKYMPTNAKRALERLKKWKYYITNQDPEPAIYSIFIHELFEDIFSDQIPKDILQQYSFIANIPTRILLHALYEQDNWDKWYDNVKTPSIIESKSELIFRTFIKAIEKAENYYGNQDIKTWKYGSLHTITLEHLFSKSALMKPVVTHGPFPHGGNHTTLNNGSWSYQNPFKQVLGASIRIVSDMSDSVLYCVLPGGVSGEPLSSHYSDQVQLWLNGGYIKLSTTKQVTSDFRLSSTFINKSKD